MLNLNYTRAFPLSHTVMIVMFCETIGPAQTRHITPHSTRLTPTQADNRLVKISFRCDWNLIYVRTFEQRTVCMTCLDVYTEVKHNRNVCRNRCD